MYIRVPQIITLNLAQLLQKTYMYEFIDEYYVDTLKNIAIF